MNLNNWQAATGPATNAFAITPSDSVNLAEPARLFVGTAGDIAVTLTGMPDGTSVTLQGVPAGFAPLLVKRVWATGTTASNLVGLS